MMTHEEMIAVIAAHRDGKKLEYLSAFNGWTDVVGSPLFAFNQNDYRIKPETKIRPWRPDEVPMPAVLRTKNGSIRWQILAVSSLGVISADSKSDNGRTGLASFEALLRHNEHSTDGGKTWKPCGVEE